MNTHAVPLGQAARPGQCGWRWHWEDVDMNCQDAALPGGDLCSEHLIEKQRRLHP